MAKPKPPRKKKKDKDEAAVSHTLESVQFTLERLGKSIASIDHSIDLMKREPVIARLNVHRETSRNMAIDRLASWAQALSTAVYNEKDKLIRQANGAHPGNGHEEEKIQ